MMIKQFEPSIQVPQINLTVYNFSPLFFLVHICIEECINDFYCSFIGVEQCRIYV